MPDPLRYSNKCNISGKVRSTTAAEAKGINPWFGLARNDMQEPVKQFLVPSERWIEWMELLFTQIYGIKITI